MNANRLSVLILALAIAATSPALANPDCSSNANLWHVHRRLDGAMDNLNHDTHDYGGHRVAAINDLESARKALVAAEQYAVNTDHDNPACFRASGPAGGSDAAWGTRSQLGSNANIGGVARWVGNLVYQLNSDRRDYGGYRAAAVTDMRAAQAQLQAAQAYARSHGY